MLYRCLEVLEEIAEVTEHRNRCQTLNAGGALIFAVLAVVVVLISLVAILADVFSYCSWCYC